MLPWASNDGAYHSPPPELMSGWLLEAQPSGWHGRAGLDGPGEVRGSQPCAYRVSLRVGQPDPGDEPVPGAHGLRDKAGWHLDQPELGTAEQPQRPVSGH